MSGYEGRGQEKRKSFRCPVAPGGEDAELLYGRRRVPVQLCNQSTGGFAALLDRDLGLKPGDLTELVTAAGSFRARVAHLDKSDPSPDGPVEAAFRVGLERVEDTAVSPSDNGRAGKRLGPRILERFLAGNVSLALRSALVSLAIAVALALVLAVLIRWNHPLARHFYQW
jgi:hypothetical protein